jgi:uncharacterized protein (DUF983 family)
MAPTPRPASFLARAVLITGRAVRRRCPHCGQPGIFTTWFRMTSRCPRCGLALEREEGYRVGAYMFNIAMAELVFVVILLVVLKLTWPSPPWEWLTYGSAAAMIVLPVVFYPYSQTLFIGFDLLFHPAEERELRPRPPS